MKNKMLAFMLCGMMTASLVACGGKDTENKNTGNEGTAVEATATPEATQAPEEEAQAPASETANVQIGQVYEAAHGTKCFTVATAVVEGDVIVDAYIDDFQFLGADADVVGVPNSDADFAANYAEGNVLASKRENAAYYSAMMADHAGSTVAINDNFDAVQAYAIGKTIAELEADATTEGIVDSVSGATLVDTPNYLTAIVNAAKAAQASTAVEFAGNTSELKLKVNYGKAHGTKCFTMASVVTAGDTVVLSNLDEFQFLTKEDGVVGVPNSDADFGAGYAEGVVLASKRVNTAYYSAMMADHAGSTVAIDANYDAIQNHVNGMTIADVTALAGEESPVDAISGATLADTAGYVNLIAETAAK